MLRWLTPALALLLGGCVLPPDVDFDEPPVRPMPSMTQSAQQIDADAFWAIVEDARGRGQGDPDKMADALDYKFYDAADATIRAFQDQLVAASKLLYTYRHGEAAELICGGLDGDGFADWRTWVIAQGRDVFDRVAANPDDIADVDDLHGGCDMWFEPVSSAASNVWRERHSTGAQLDDLNFPTDPGGVRLHGDDAIRAALPKVAART
jgi:hypothetical protein